jgi:4-hydroxy-3-polyprenylbenzoate decarboxylase
VHHAAAIRRGETLPVSIWIGGPPALAVAAVMPLPEGLSELSFAGALAGHRMPLISQWGSSGIHAEADFCIVGEIEADRLKLEGPFGDHLGYYSLAHEFPVMDVHRVYHRPGAVWPFTTVGRPPQEDTSFGQFIHELTGPIVPTLIPGVRGVHAVDAAGVHPLLLALGSERYVPYATERRPQELLTQANAILGQGQMSLAKYLWIAAHEDDPRVDLHDVQAFFYHVLQRVDWSCDLHFQTNTTIDTLDYSGTGLNEGSKVVIASAGSVRRSLPRTIDFDLRLPSEFTAAHVAMPGVLCVTSPRYVAGEGADQAERFCWAFEITDALSEFPLVVLCDDSEFTGRTLANFLWVTFTRSNPAVDIYGIESFTVHKHWGCRGSLVIDARLKPHHAPPLEEDPEITRRVDALAARGGPLHGII